MNQAPSAPLAERPKIAVIGAGAAGRSFALACALAGYTVVVEDVMPSNLRHAEAEFAAFGKDVDLAMTVEDAVREADLVVDFVPDELESKLEIFSMVDRMAPPRTVMCTPSAVLSITDLASCTYRPERCLMVRGLLNGAAGERLRLLYAEGVAVESVGMVTQVFVNLGYAIQAQPDPDLPMLMKNMGYAPTRS